MKFNKKAQSEIITTVLIILLVLAAIIIVWQVIQGTVKKGTDQINTQTACMGINLEIVKVNTTAAIVTRKPGADASVVSNVTFLVAGTVVPFGVQDSPGLGVLTSKQYNLPSLAGQKVEVAAVLSDGTKCNPTGSANTVA